MPRFIALVRKERRARGSDDDGADETEKKNEKKRARERRGRADAIMRVSLLTECVEILDGHTTNKRDPSDDIELRSAGDGRRAER